MSRVHSTGPSVCVSVCAVTIETRTCAFYIHLTLVLQLELLFKPCKNKARLLSEQIREFGCVVVEKQNHTSAAIHKLNIKSGIRITSLLQCVVEYSLLTAFNNLSYNGVAYWADFITLCFVGGGQLIAITACFFLLSTGKYFINHHLFMVALQFLPTCDLSRPEGVSLSM